MLTDIELSAARAEVTGSHPYPFQLDGEYALWIARMIRSEADARLLLIPIRRQLPSWTYEEPVEVESGSPPSRLDRIDQLLQYWDDPPETKRLEEAIDQIEILLEVVVDLSSEWYQPAYAVLDAIGHAIGRRIGEHKNVHQEAPPG